MIQARACIVGAVAMLFVGGCGHTLVFGEHDGVNFAIRANANSTPPIEVNFGLDRAVATIVPPAGEKSGSPSGEAVNMFAGFQIERFNDITLTKPVAVDLQITTQFASGAAATAVAGSPAVVAQIVKLSGITVQRDAAFVHTFGSRSELLGEINRLDGPQRVAVASEMAPKLAERTDPAVRRLDGAVPRNGLPMSENNAHEFLAQWAAEETLTPAFAAEWAAALAHVAK
jgi:hypothetical protein